MSNVGQRTSGTDCGPCEEGCEIVTDDFSTDTDANWTDVDGTGTVSSGERSTSSSTFLSVHNTAGTTGHGKVTVRGKVSVSGGKFRLNGSWVDDDNYLYAEATVSGGSSTVKLWKRESGTDTQLGSTSYTFSLSTDTYCTLELCWDGENATAALNNVARAGDSYTGTGNKAGIGATLSSGTATFDDFTFSKHSIDDAECDECSPGGCSACSDFVHTITVEIDGLVDGSCTCSDDNGHTYVVRIEGDGSCSNRINTGRSPCGFGANSAVEAGVISVSGTTYLTVDYITRNAAGGKTTTYRTSIGSTPAACEDADDDTTLPFVATTDSSPFQCNSNSATVTASIN